MLREYVDAARGRADAYFDGLASADFERITLTNPRGGTITLANMCQQLIWEFNQHGGQIAYLRGIQRGIEDAAYSGGMLEAAAARASESP